MTQDMKKDTILHTITKLLVRNWRTPVRSAAYSSALTSAQNNTRNLSVNEMTSRRSRDYGSCPTRLRLVVLMLLMMVLGVNKTWGQTDYSGIYYIASTGYSEDVTNSENNTNFYLCPTKNWYYYQSTSPFYTDTSNGMPFMTTYQHRKSESDPDKAQNEAIWIVEKKSGTNYYYIKHAIDGKYLTFNVAMENKSNAGRMRVHLEESPADDDDALFEIIWIANKKCYDIKTKKSGADNASRKFVNVNQGNFSSLVAQHVNNKDDGPNGMYIGGIIGLWTKGSDDSTSQWHLEKATADPPTITDNTDGTFTIAAETGATIYYTTDGTTPTTSTTTTATSGTGTTSVNVTQNGSITVIKAIAKRTTGDDLSYFPSVVTTYEPPKCETPIITISEGSVSITCPTVGATIYYTIDGSDPATSGTRNTYSTSFALGGTTKIRAIAQKGSLANSDEAVYRSGKCKSPTIVLDKTNGLTTITPQTEDEGATIYYTIDGTTPTIASTQYTVPFTLPNDASSIKAIATLSTDGSDASPVTEQTLTKLAPPTFTKEGATITINKPTKEEDGTTALLGPDAVIVYYNLNNNNPTATSSTQYSSAITLPDNFGQTVIKAIAYKSGYIKSDVASFNIDQCATPTIVNNYDGTVTVTCATEGVTLRYTTSTTTSAPGDPGLSSVVVGADGKVTLPEGTRIIKARAFKSGFCQSVAKTYILPICPVPVITNNEGQITITSEFGQIFYTTSDTGTPETPYPVGGFSLGNATIVRAYAKHAGYIDSEIVIWKKATPISSASDVTDLNGNYLINGSFSGSIGTSESPFTGTIDGQLQVITGLSAPIVLYADGATIKNVIVNISSLSGESEAGNKGAIVCEATGDTRIYNCGVLSGSISGTNYVGGIAGKLDGKARVINCYSFADITGGNVVGGIVGYNNSTTTRTSINTMVMNCMFYGNITGGTTVSPIYGGNIISNVDNTGLNNFNYFRQEATFSGTLVYNCALAMEERYLNRIEFFRNMENSNRELAAIYATGNAENAYDKMAKWVLDKSVADYPILKEQGYYSSVINYDPSAAPETPEEQKTIDIVISGITTLSGVKVTDKDPNHFNYNYNKVQLPYYNDYRKDNYQGNRVVTGWDIVSVTGSNEVTYEAFEDNNYANFLSKDKYSGRVFSQGAYFDVPKGVTSITISPHWAQCVYLSDECYDATGYSSQKVSQLPRYSNNTQYVINGSSQVVYTTWAKAIENLPSGGSSVYDRAIVLVGNYHNSSTPPTGTTPFTIMSADLNFDNEPDYSLIYHHTTRKPITPIRFDFINVPGTSMVQKVTGTGDIRIMAVLTPEGWFEITNTCLVRFSQFEYDSSKKTASAPVILQGGYYEQFIASNDGSSVNTSYLHLGSNVWIKEFSDGSHVSKTNTTKHCPISITGGQYDKFYLSGLARPDVNSGANNHARCYINGGIFTELAGAGQEQIDGNVTWQICNADITDFYGGGINAGKPITGNISITLYGGNIGTFCGGPKFGNMANGKTVRTTATGTTFGTYFGAGNGGTSFYRDKIIDMTCKSNYKESTSPYNPTSSDWDGWTANYVKGKYQTGKGIAANFEYEFIDGSENYTVARVYVNYASFSLAKTNDVTSTLNKCTITGNFYGGGNLGEVRGTATSTLNGCTVNGNVYGAGYSVTVPAVDLMNSNTFTGTYPTGYPYYDKNSGVYHSENEIALPTTTPYTWSSKGSVTNNSTVGSLGTDSEGNWIHTDEDLTSLGQVRNVVLTIDNYTKVNGEIIEAGNIDNNVFGGGAKSNVKGDVTVTIQGSGIAGDVYGGGEEAQTNTKESVTLEDNTVVTPENPVTQVNLSGGTITGNLYGGGLGTETKAADVNGPVTVTVTGGTATNVFGCNNINGAPQSTVQVDIEKAASSTMSVTNVFGGGNLATYTGDPIVNVKNGTVSGNVYGGGAGVLVDGAERGVKGKVTGNPQVTIGDNDENHIAKVVGDVYGGGDAADVAGTPVIIVNDCATEIGNLYGGGNAADVSGSTITVNGGIIGYAFGGGHGDKDASDPDKYADVNGNVTFNVYGGTISHVFAGSNSRGQITGTSALTINKTGSCAMKIGEVYGGGNEAAGVASTVNIQCTGDLVTGDDGHAANPDKIGTDLEGIGCVYGGANQADIGATGEGHESNIEVNIKSGIVANVFGGNNTSGTIYGTITVNIEKDDDASCASNWYVGNVFGGGNLATYAGSPVVNIKNGTVSGNVYGGGNGDPTDNTQAKGSTGAPTVTIGDLAPANSAYQAIVLGDVYGGGNTAKVTGDVAPSVTVQKTNTEVGYVYGGGNAADVPATSVTISDGTIHHDVYGGGHGDKASLNTDQVTGHSDKTANVTGNVDVNITGGMINKVFAGSNLNGSIGGTVELEIDKAAGASTMKIGEVYGGGNQAAGNAGEITIGCTGTWTETGENNHTNHNSTTNRIGYDLEGIGTVYGGANAANVGNSITLNITGGIVENVFGGNNTSGSIEGDITVNIEKGDATCSWYLGNVYGGGNLAAYSQKTAGHPAVNIKNGTVSGNVYGGGKGSTAVVTGNPIVTIGDDTSGHAAIVTGDVYGGGDAAAMTGNTTVTYNDNNTSSTVARLFGGGNAAGVSGTSTVTMTLGKVTGGVYGGCNSSGSVGTVTIALNGGQVGTDATHRADVYGGGLGSSTTTTGDIGVTLGTDASTGTTVYGDIYGGSALGSVNASASNTSTVTLTSATLYGSVFGGGKGDNASEGDGHSDVTATSNGGATVNINVANTNLTGIYGGANIRGNVKGAINVNVNANVGATGTGNSLDIFGGGYGANTNTEGNVTVTIGDADGTYQPVIYGDIYGGSALGNVNNDASDITTVNFLNGTLHGDLYGGGLGNAGNAAKVNGKVIVNISNEDQLASNCHIDLREASIYGCNNANGSPQDDVTVNIYKTDHTSDNGISGTAYAIDQVFGGGDQADYAPENGSASSTKKATVNIIGCNNTIRRVFGGGNAAAAVGVVTRIDGGHFDYVYGGGNGEVTAANIGAGGTNLQIHGGNINNLFGGSNAQGTITGNMGVSVDNACDCEGSGGTAQYVNEFFCGNNLASIGTAQNPVTINATIACGTRFGAVYGGCNLAPLYGSVNLTVEGGVMDYVYGGSKGRLADDSDPTNPITAVAADISGNVTLTIKGGQIKNVFGGSNINGNIAGIITVNIERVDATPACADGWYVGNVYGGSNLAAYTPTIPGNYPAVNIKNGTVNGNVYGGGKGASATVTSNPVVTIGDVTTGHESYVAKVEDKDDDTEADGTTALVGGNVYGGGDAAPVVGSTTVLYNDNNASTTVANIFGGGNNASVSGNAIVTLKGKATVEQNVFGGGNKGIVQGKATVNIEE